jgi:hypothetical protein
MESDDDVYVCAALITMNLIKRRLELKKKKKKRRRLLWTQCNSKCSSARILEGNSKVHANVQCLFYQLSELTEYHRKPDKIQAKLLVQTNAVCS